MENIEKCEKAINEIQGNIDYCYHINMETLYTALEVLKKQIPKKPKGDYHSCPHYRCPNCSGSVKMYEADNTYPHCAFCGQKLDWGGANG